MRGAPFRRDQVHHCSRIIPADAGSTYSVGNSADAKKDHPRGCGEHWYSRLYQLIKVGSSPRMRGAPGHHQRPALRPGIIPADAGSTMQVEDEAGVLQDHPRGCGEHCPICEDLPRGPGSSPRMRGARTQTCHLAPDPGIIPADAESTQ